MDSQYSELINNIRVKDSIQISINSSFLESNFELIKQCLKKISSLKAEVTKQSKINKQIIEKFTYMQKDIANNNTKNEGLDRRLQILEKKQFLDDVYKKLHELQQKSEVKVTSDINIDTVIKQMKHKFVTLDQYKQSKNQIDNRLKQINKVKQQLERFVDNNSFNTLKNQIRIDFAKFHQQILIIQDIQTHTKNQIKQTQEKISKIDSTVNQNTNMIKDINFSQVEAKLKRLRDEINYTVSDMSKKIKKIISVNELNQLERDIITKLDQYLANQNQKLADKNQTKKALLFLENRINLLIAPPLQTKEEDIDSLFATKQWTCAACTNNLGKFQGKLNKYKPWAVFPCRQLSPQKSGGYGYVSYLDKVSTNKGVSLDDSNLDRLNDTGILIKRDNKHLMNKLTNAMSNYGENIQNYPRLLGMYFKNYDHIFNSKKEDQEGKRVQSAVKGQKTFRVKKQIQKKE